MAYHPWDPICPPPERLVHPVRIDPAGVTGPTRGQARGPGWRRTSYGFYVPADVDGGVPEQRVVEQAIRLPDGGAVTGWGSLRLHRSRFHDGLESDGLTRRPVLLAVGPDGRIRDDDQVTLSRSPLDGSEVTTVDGVRITVPVRALFDEARHSRDVRDATVAIDMAAAAQRISLWQLRTYVERRSGWRGVDRVRRALGLASEYSRSPFETRMRLVWQLDAGLPRPRVNQAVYDRRGRLLGVADILDVKAGVAGEYDGGEHLRHGRRSKDVAKEDRFRRVGLEVFRVLRPDMADTGLVVDRMVTARRRALWLPESARAWTIEAPDDESDMDLDTIIVQREMLAELHRRAELEGDPDIAELIRL